MVDVRFLSRTTLVCGDILNVSTLPIRLRCGGVPDRGVAVLVVVMSRRAYVQGELSSYGSAWQSLLPLRFYAACE
jgi:hypothetical protein